jgi:serine/threonine protein kinase
MQYVEGETLADRIQRGPITSSELLNVGIQAADAFAEAHSRGIIHRDIKPANIMLTTRQQVKVMDFGLAKNLAGPAGLDSVAETQSLLTEPGMIVGTAPYMSPEQVHGKTVTAVSDVFSFGAVLYEMATGKRAFNGDSQMAILASILNQEPELPAKVPLDLGKIILRCLRKDPARRYQTMTDLKVALEDLRLETTISTRRAPAQRRSRWKWFALPAAVLFGGLGLFAWQQLRPRTPTETLRARPLTTLTGVKRYPSFSPDGNYITFTWSGEKQDNPDIYVQQVSSGSPSRRTTDPGNDYNPVWSPDGNSIAFLRSKSEIGTSELILIPPISGSFRLLAVRQSR